MIAVTAKQILQGRNWAEGLALLIEGGKIQDIVAREHIPSNMERRNFGDTYLAPGLFDIQVNGGGDVLLNDDPSVQSLLTIARAHQSFGTTSLLPTLITAQTDTMRRAANAVAEARDLGHAQIKGIHFEGPFLNTDRKGVHHAPYIRKAETTFLDILDDVDLGSVLVTLAPENTPADFIQELLKRNVTISMGHTNADYDTAMQAGEQGVSGFTHLFNAMPPFLSREPGPVGAAFENASLFASVIADGHHIHPSSLRTALNILGPDRAMLITDAMPPVGGQLKQFQLMDLQITLKNGRYETADGTLAGACIGMWDAVRYCHEVLKQPMTDCLQMASQTPARFMGLDRRIGRLQTGYDADFVVFAPSGDLISTHLATEWA